MSERSTKWQRDNFSNKQILEYLRLLKVDEEEFGDLAEKGWNGGWNGAIESLEEMFYCLDLPDTEFGAMAFNKENKMFEHIGKEPEDARKSREKLEKGLKDRVAASEEQFKEELEKAVGNLIAERTPLSAVVKGANEFTIPLAD